AAAAGLPVIGGNSGGVPEALGDGVTGFLVDGRDAGELARKIRLLTESSDLRRRMGDAGRARVVREFTWNRAAARLMEAHSALDLAAGTTAEGVGRDSNEHRVAHAAAGEAP